MATRTIEAELLDLEKRYWQAIKGQDVDAAIRLTDEPCIVIGAQGIGLLDRKTLAAMMRATSYTLNRFVLPKAKPTIKTAALFCGRIAPPRLEPGLS